MTEENLTHKILQKIQADIAGLKSDISELKTLKSDVAEMRAEMRRGFETVHEQIDRASRDILEGFDRNRDLERRVARLERMNGVQP